MSYKYNTVLSGIIMGGLLSTGSALAANEHSAIPTANEKSGLETEEASTEVVFDAAGQLVIDGTSMGEIIGARLPDDDPYFIELASENNVCDNGNCELTSNGECSNKTCFI